MVRVPLLPAGRSPLKVRDRRAFRTLAQLPGPTIRTRRRAEALKSDEGCGAGMRSCQLSTICERATRSAVNQRSNRVHTTHSRAGRPERLGVRVGTYSATVTLAN